MLNDLTHSRYSPSSGGSAQKYVIDYVDLLQKYNDQQIDPSQRLQDLMKKALLRSSVSTVTQLRAVSDREQERIVLGDRAFTFEEYYVSLKGSAAIYDESRQVSRRANMADITGDVDEDQDSEDQDGSQVNDSDIASEITEYCINEMRRGFRRPSPASSMNKETWTSLSKEAQETWDKMPREDKAKILRYAGSRAKPSSRQANVTEIESSDDSAKVLEANVHEQESTQVQESGDDSTTQLRCINNAVATARGKAHPGDPRRMMGSDKPASKTLLAKNVSFGPPSILGASGQEVPTTPWSQPDWFTQGSDDTSDEESGGSQDPLGYWESDDSDFP